MDVEGALNPLFGEINDDFSNENKPTRWMGFQVGLCGPNPLFHFNADPFLELPRHG